MEEFRMIKRFFSKSWKKAPLRHSSVKVCAISLVASFGFTFPWGAGAAAVSPEAVWAKAEELGRRSDIDPILIYSIACAESSLDERADSGQARGIMQISRVAWKEVTPRSYDDAWQWQTNMEVAAKYLHRLRVDLENSGHYSWQILAASYHYGPRRVEAAGYRVWRLPREHNRIYRALFAGRTPNLPGAIPTRRIDQPFAIRVFAASAPSYPIVQPLLDVAELDGIARTVPEVLAIVPLAPFQDASKILADDEDAEASDSEMLEPLYLFDSSLVAPLANVPEVETLFSGKKLDLPPLSLTDGVAAPLPVIAGLGIPTGPAPIPQQEIRTVEEPADNGFLDTTIGGLAPLAAGTKRPSLDAIAAPGLREDDWDGAPPRIVSVEPDDPAPDPPATAPAGVPGSGTGALLEFPALKDGDGHPCEE
jgi:hypothetical protein